MRSLWIVFGLIISGCGVAYISPSVSTNAAGAKVEVVALTFDSVDIANRSKYRPRQLPAVFFQSAGTSQSIKRTRATPSAANSLQNPPNLIQTLLPPETLAAPYRIGVGDVLVLATRQAGTTVEELTGLLAAQNRRQGYTVQDDGAIAIPDVGRVQVNSLTLEEAEATLFRRLVENQIDPSFSIEVSEFNSKRASIGGAVRAPTVVPMTLTPLYLDEALAAAGGVEAADKEYVTVRIYRNGSLYQLPLKALPNNRIRIISGDRVIVDTEYQREQAQDYLNEQRENFKARIEMGAVERDYVYLTGEMKNQTRFALPFNRTATLADALYSEGGALTKTSNPSQIYVLRGSTDPAGNQTITAWHLDARNIANVLLATRLELRPNDVVFVAEQPITKWNRVITQFVPALITAGVAATVD